jgi:transcriptional regulator with XRE-family HTH domain
MVVATTSRELLAMADFRENLVRLRKERRLTQMQLAELLDVQPRLISRWETGETKPQFDHMVRLAEVLEVSLDDLARGPEAAAERGFDIRNKRLQELCRRVDGLSQEDQEVVCHVMDSLIRKEQVKAIMSGALPQTGGG